MKMSKPVNKIATKVLNYIADTELYEWPPQCPFIYYQPKRPSRIEIQDKVNDATEKTRLHGGE